MVISFFSLDPAQGQGYSLLVPCPSCPLLCSVNQIEEAAKRTTATAFEIYDRYLQANEKNDTGLLAKREQYIVRELILLQKVFASKEAVDVLRTSLSIFGGHGVMEEFSSLPRLFRDAIVNELWEGPRNVLLAQVFRDLEKMQSWYPVNEFIADIFNGTGKKDLVDSYSSLLNELLETPIYGEVNKSNVAHAKRWERFCGDFFYDYQKHIVDKFEDLPLDVKIEDLISGEELPNSHDGEILCRGPQVFKGYWNNPEESSKVLADGWYRSGDVGRIDKFGTPLYVSWLLGLKRDPIIEVNDKICFFSSSSERPGYL